MIKFFSDSEYADFDSRMRYRADKLRDVKKYQASYNYVSEFIHRQYEGYTSAVEIAKRLSVTKDCIYKILERMGIEMRGKGGAFNTCDISLLTLGVIRNSKEKHAILAGRYGVSAQTIGNMKRRVGRWSKI